MAPNTCFTFGNVELKEAIRRRQHCSVDHNGCGRGVNRKVLALWPAALPVARPQFFALGPDAFVVRLGAGLVHVCSANLPRRDNVVDNLSHAAGVEPPTTHRKPAAPLRKALDVVWEANAEDSRPQCVLAEPHRVQVVLVDAGNGFKHGDCEPRVPSNTMTS